MLDIDDLAFTNNKELINNIKQVICQSLIANNSVLQIPREGINYSIDTSRNKPFENIQQLYAQQTRHDRKYKNTYFMPYSDVLNNGFAIKKNARPIVLPYINKVNSQVEYSFFYNCDQFSNNDKTYTLAKELYSKPPPIPYCKKEISHDIDIYQPKTFKLQEQFTRIISEYFLSCYTGKTYDPPQYTQEEIKKLVDFITKDDSPFFKNVQKAHRTIKNNLLSHDEKLQKDHARIR